MTGKEETGQHQRFCGKCVAPVRPGTTFCTSCGERLDQEAEDPEVQHNEVEDAGGPTPPREPWAPTGRINDDSGPGPGLGYRRVLERIENLPMALKIAGAVVGALLLLTVLSPLAIMAGAVLFGASMIGVIVRVAQQRSPLGWGITAVASIVAMFAFTAVADVIYSSDFLGGSDEKANLIGGGNPNDRGAVSNEEPRRLGASGVDKSNPLWAFDVTCQQLQGNDELKSAVARDLAETINTPLGPQAAIDSLERTLPRVCRGVDPLYAPATRALELTEAEVGDD